MHAFTHTNTSACIHISIQFIHKHTYMFTHLHDYTNIPSIDTCILANIYIHQYLDTFEHLYTFKNTRVRTFIERWIHTPIPTHKRSAWTHLQSQPHFPACIQTVLNSDPQSVRLLLYFLTVCMFSYLVYTSDGWCVCVSVWLYVPIRHRYLCISECMCPLSSACKQSEIQAHTVRMSAITTLCMHGAHIHPHKYLNTSFNSGRKDTTSLWTILTRGCVWSVHPPPPPTFESAYTHAWICKWEKCGDTFVHWGICCSRHEWVHTPQPHTTFWKQRISNEEGTFARG